ncbi:MAG: hypothetical protein HFF87_07125 [Oscillibacter sp.]|nr:hypothetical protein [Oscillibacter sp.]
MVNIHIFHSISAKDLLAGEHLLPEANGLGIYFHVYKNAVYPFYIGISSDMAGRNRNHLENYQKKRYWMVKNPHRLTDLRCFVKDEFYSTYDFYKPGRDAPCREWDHAVEQLFDHMTILFSHITLLENGTEPPQSPEAARRTVEQVERQLQNNMVQSLNLYPDWIGRTGSNRGGGLDAVTHRLSLTYAGGVSHRLNEKVLLCP